METIQVVPKSLAANSIYSKTNEAEIRNKSLLQVSRLKKMVGIFSGGTLHAHFVFAALFPDRDQTGVRAIVLLLSIGWLLRDSRKEKDLKGKNIFIMRCNGSFGNALTSHLDKEESVSLLGVSQRKQGNHMSQPHKQDKIPKMEETHENCRT